MASSRLLIRASLWLMACAVGLSAQEKSAGLSTPGTNVYPNDDVAIARADAVFLPAENSVYCVAFNPATNMALFACNSTNPTTVVQVDMGSLSTPPTRIGAVQLNPGENNLVTAVLDSVNNVALFSTDTSPSQIIKIAFGTGGSPPSRVGAVTLNAGENRVYAAVIDPASGQALFGTFTSPGVVVKVALNAAGAAPTRINALSLNAGENSLASAVLDTTNGIALFGTYGTSPGMAVKVAMNNIASAPTRVGAVTFNTGEDTIVSAVMDANTNTAYFGTFTSPGYIVKVAFDQPANPPVRVGSVQLNTGESVLYASAIDPASGVLMTASNNGAGVVAKVKINAAAAAPTRAGGATFPAGASGFVASFFDSANGRFIFVPNTASNTKLFSVLYSPQGMVTGTKVTVPEAAVVSDVRLYTHLSGSSVRMAIYDSGNNLLWQSPALSSVDNGEVVAQISSGTPASLNLAAGDYYLAFQSSTTATVPSFTAGTAGDGFVAYQNFGSFAASVVPTSTAAKYTQYITYSTGAGKNISDGAPPVTNPVNGIKISVASSNGGLITLAIDVNSVNRAPTTATTDFDDIPGRQSKNVSGLTPSHLFTQPGVFVATATGIDVPTGASRGKMRKQLALSARETGQSGALALPESTAIGLKALKGKFLLTKSTPDQVSFTGTIQLPAGFDIARADGQTLSLGIGNIVDTVVVSPKGKGALPSALSRVKSLKVKYPRLAKGTTLTTGGESATIQFTLNLADMDTSGFDTEGITATLAAGEDAKSAAPRNIQVSLVLAGAAYEIIAPVQFKLSGKQDAGTISLGRTSAK